MSDMIDPPGSASFAGEPDGDEEAGGQSPFALMADAFVDAAQEMVAREVRMAMQTRQRVKVLHHATEDGHEEVLVGWPAGVVALQEGGAVLLVRPSQNPRVAATAVPLSELVDVTRMIGSFPLGEPSWLRPFQAAGLARSWVAVTFRHAVTGELGRLVGRANRVGELMDDGARMPFVLVDDYERMTGIPAHLVDDIEPAHPDEIPEAEVTLEEEGEGGEAEPAKAPRPL